MHGHVGPYLVLGLKMGNVAKKVLNISDEESQLLHADVLVPMKPPTSCLLDGVQVSTTCTIGNQRLQFTNASNIQVFFSSQKDAKAVKIKLTTSLVEQLEQMEKQNRLYEAYAWELAKLPENQLFEIAVE